MTCARLIDAETALIDRARRWLSVFLSSHSHSSPLFSSFAVIRPYSLCSLCDVLKACLLRSSCARIALHSSFRDVIRPSKHCCSFRPSYLDSFPPGLLFRLHVFWSPGAYSYNRWASCNSTRNRLSFIFFVQRNVIRYRERAYSNAISRMVDISS